MPDPAPPPSHSPFDITKGFVDAVRLWSDYLRLDPATDYMHFGHFGAAEFLTAIGFDLPLAPISTEDLTRLEILAQRAKDNNEKPLTTRDLKKAKTEMKPLADAVSVYFRANCGVDFDVDADATGFIEKTVDSVDTAVAVFQSQYDTVPDFFNTVGSFTTGQSSPANDYEAMDDLLDGGNLSQEEFEAANNAPVDTEYWKPPPPEHFNDTFGKIE